MFCRSSVREKMRSMDGLDVRSFDAPDEARGDTALVTIGRQLVGRSVFEPGWRLDGCDGTHLLYCVSGRMAFRTSDGREIELGAGEVAAVGPGHDAWTVGDEACVLVDFGGFAQS